MLSTYILPLQLSKNETLFLFTNTSSIAYLLLYSTVCRSKFFLQSQRFEKNLLFLSPASRSIVLFFQFSKFQVARPNLGIISFESYQLYSTCTKTKKINAGERGDLG